MCKRKKRMGSVLRITLLVLAALVIGTNVYTINAARLAGNQVPMPFGVGAAVVLSGSMEPALSAGDLLIVAGREAYEVGDVVVFQDGSMAVTHRIIAVGEDEVITRGDANNTEDDPISPSQIKGEVVLAIPLVGYVVRAIKTPLGTLAILALAILLLERSFHAEKQRDVCELERIKQEIEELKRERRNNS